MAAVRVPAPPGTVLVVGAGLAGARTAGALRAAGWSGHLRVLGAEGLPPYDRPPLSKHLLDRPEPAWLAGELDLDLAVLADDLRLDTPAAALELGGSRPRVHTDAGTYEADVVVLAGGAHAVLPAGWDHALTLHTAADAARLRSRLAVPGGARLVVVGAGWIGAEVAGVAAAAGHQVTVVEAAGPLASAVGPSVGALTTPWYAAAGVRLITGRAVSEVRADGVRLEDGTSVDADVVLAAVGARPSTAWLAGTLPLTAAGAVPVDGGHAVVGPGGGAVGAGARLASVGAGARLASVRAVGDIAVRRSRRHGQVPGGHWDGALRGPDALVADLLGPGGEPPDPAPYVFSRQLGHDLALYGLPGPGDDVVLRLGDPGWAALWFGPRDDELHAALVVDRPREVAAVRRLFGGAALPRLDRAAAADPDRPLR